MIVGAGFKPARPYFVTLAHFVVQKSLYQAEPEP